MQKLDLTGQQFGQWTALKSGKKTAYWLCKCACGREVEVFIGSLRAGKSKGCSKCQSRWMSTSGQSSRNATKHGLHRSDEYRSWKMMKEHCSNPKQDNWAYYGGRGILVCDKWKNSFEEFYKDMGPKPKDYSIDRIDVNKNYEPGNCKWSSTKEQNRNKVNNIWVDLDGERILLIDAAARYNIS